jgi:phosphatidylglycerophosphate synthase
MVSLHWYGAALVFWWLGRLFDGTDGIYARDSDQATAFGGYLDIVLDMASYSIMLIGFYLASPQRGLQWLGIAVLYTLCITSALALGEYETKHQLGTEDHRSLRLATGLAEGGETGVFYTLMLLFPSRWSLLIGCWILILCFTVVSRSFLAYRMMAPEKKG